MSVRFLEQKEGLRYAERVAFVSPCIFQVEPQEAGIHVLAHIFAVAALVMLIAGGGHELGASTRSRSGSSA
ncbi:MAG: hypothetical protein ACRDZ5_11595 [Acidimicrobiales bacterium]